VHIDKVGADPLNITKVGTDRRRCFDERTKKKRSVYELYARGRTYEELHEQNRSSGHLWDKYVPSTSFKFVVNGYNRSISKIRQREVIEDFAYMGLLGKIDLKRPEVTMGCFEECANSDKSKA
jgi:tRNA (guanine10-N2)-methyltransferase